MLEVAHEGTSIAVCEKDRLNMGVKNWRQRILTDEKNPNFLLDLIETVREETRPIEGHTDPGAIDDCWDEIIERIEHIAKSSVASHLLTKAIDERYGKPGENRY